MSHHVSTFAKLDPFSFGKVWRPHVNGPPNWTIRMACDVVKPQLRHKSRVRNGCALWQIFTPGDGSGSHL
jgi:hypothetical protein